MVNRAIFFRPLPELYCKFLRDNAVISTFCSVRYASTTKCEIKLDQNILSSSESIKYRKHPGKMVIGPITLPHKLTEAMQQLLIDYNLKDLIQKSEAFSRHLGKRCRPIKDEFLQRKMNIIEEKIIKQETFNLDNLNEKQRRDKLSSRKGKLLKQLRQQIYHWKSIKYDYFTGVQYMIGRMPSIYSVLCQIFNEIKIRQPDFKPKNILDFGSGVGSTMWAADYTWKNSFNEFVNVDVSNEMNSIAALLNQEGKEMKNPILKEVFFRQFLAKSHRIKFDIVVSAYSLMDLESEDERLRVISDLWCKTDQFLIIVECGTLEGHKTVMEARDLILEAGKKSIEIATVCDFNLSDEENVSDLEISNSQLEKDVKLDRTAKFKTKLLLEPGYVFAPCPHDMVCPRLLNVERIVPCSFQVSFNPVSFLYPTINVMKEPYSYVILHKSSKENKIEWPRILEPVLPRSRHAICQLCCSNGSEVKVVFTAYKHGKSLYHCARKSCWGDLLPVTQEWLTKEDPVEE